jgi:hypothetical protein
MRSPGHNLSGTLVALDLADLRIAGLTMCGASLLLPALPGYDGVTCPLRGATGIPCPLCGLTTSVRATLSGDLSTAWAATPAGIAAVLATVVLALSSRRVIGVPSLLVPVVLGAMWLYQLSRFSLL